MKFLVADDHELVLDAVVALLQATWPDASIETATHADQAVAAIEQSDDFSLVLLDLQMPGFNGVADIEKAMADRASPYAILSGSVGQREGLKLITAGARGFIPKSMPANSMIAAVHLMLSGQRFIPAELPDENDAELMLTDRERDVLSCLHEGGSNKEIARSLGIQETTVKLHLRSLAVKLDARNRTEIVIKSLKLRLL